MKTRNEITRHYLHGHGLEIAGLHNPWPLNPGSRAIQMDLFTTDELYAQYPEHKNQELVKVQVLDNGNFCTSIPSNSMDFVVSSHVLEHCEDTITAIYNWLRVVKPFCFVAMAVPHKDNPIDHAREVTTQDHFWEEHESTCEEVNGVWTALNRRNHYHEYFTIVDKLSGPALFDRMDSALISQPHIHWHTFTEESLSVLLTKMEDTAGHFKIREYERVGHEMLVVLQRTV